VTAPAAPPASTRRRRLHWAWLGACVLFLLHNDVPLWWHPRLPLGVMPAGLAYHLAYCLVSSAFLALLVRWFLPPGDAP